MLAITLRICNQEYKLLNQWAYIIDFLQGLFIANQSYLAGSNFQIVFS